MGTRLNGRLSLLFLAFAVVVLIFPAMALGQDSGGTSPAPTIQSDQSDYPPGATVTLNGSNWQPGESVHINVNDDEGQTWSRDVDVTADTNGQIQDQFQLPDWFVATYKVTATGAQSDVATTSFTDARVVTSAKLNGGNSVNVQPGDAITAKVDVTTDGTGANARWRSTGWRIAATAPNATSDVTCVDNDNHDGAGSSSETFSINAPNASGTYNAYFIAFSDDTCTWSSPGSGSGQSTTFTLSNGVVVESATRATTTSVARTAGSNPSTYGQPVTFTATVDATGGNPNGVGSVTFKDGTDAISGCSNVSLSGNTATCTTSALSAAASPHSITAQYSGATSGSTTFGASTSSALTQTVNKATPTVSITWANAIYDGNANAASAAVSGIGNPPENLGPASLTYYAGSTATGTPLSGAPKDAGTYTVQASFDGNADYIATSNTKTITIAPKSVSGSFTASNKVYDGTTDATITDYTLNGKINGDQVSLGVEGAQFDNKNVGTGKTVTVTTSDLAGPDAGNYSLAGRSWTTTANITVRPITVTADTGQSKVYGSADPALTYNVTNGSLVQGDSFSGVLSRAAGEDVGSYAIKQGTLTASNNYDLTFVGADFTINKRAITVTADPQTKVYGENDPELTYKLTDNTSLANGDSFTGNLIRDTGENVGTYAIRKGTLSLGNDEGNYELTFNGANLAITSKPLTGSFTASNKVYDGTTDATIASSHLDGVVGNDDVHLDGDQASFADKNVAQNKTVTVNRGSLSGNDAGNYTLANGPWEATADITPKSVSGSFTAGDKIYDGSTNAQIIGRSLNTSDIITNDDVNLSGGSASFADKNVGNAKAVSGTGFSLSGADKDNYSLDSVANTTASITAKELIGSFTAADKVYDGNANATVTANPLQGKFNGETVDLVVSNAHFDDENAGQNKTVSADLALSGADASNYTLKSTTASTEANITKKDITGSFTAQNKVYDGNDSATVTGRSVNQADVVGSDNVSLTGGTASFDNNNVGTGKTVTLSGASLAGTDAGNYNLISVGTATADITVRPITVTADPQTKVYGQADPILSYKVTSQLGLAQGDSFSGALTRDDGETVAGSPYAIKQGTLSAGSNYNLNFVGANLTITAANTTTTVTVTPSSPQYSDLVTLTATVNGPDTPTGSVQFKIDGVNVGSSQTLSGGSASLSDYQVMQAPGAHSVTAIFTSSSSNWNDSASTPATLPVTPEDAKSEFSGQTFYAVPSGSATVTLSAVITDAADGSRGDIRNAKVTFVNRDTGATLCTANVGLITSGDTTVGAATCNVSLSYGSTGSTQYTVGIKVGGHYVDNNPVENSVVTVSQATSGMITGGGYLVNSNSGGQYAGDKGQKTNFGYNVKYNKSNTNLQGNINTIVRRGDRVYQIKGNSMTSLTTTVATATKPGTATFNGKASIQDITNPSAPIPVDGNASLQVTMTDRGEPGKDDTIGITVWSKNGGLWFSSNWVSPKTVEQVLGGGNVVVR
jgi:hypothetical protein